MGSSGQFVTDPGGMRKEDSCWAVITPTCAIVGAVIVFPGLLCWLFPQEGRQVGISTSALAYSCTHYFSWGQVAICKIPLSSVFIGLPVLKNCNPSS